MSGTIKGLCVGALAFASTIGTTVNAQEKGLVTIQKLSAKLANELVGETVAICAQRVRSLTVRDLIWCGRDWGLFL